MRATLAVKASAIVTLIIVLAVGLIVMLDYFKFGQTLREVTESRLGFVAQDLRNSIQTGLDLGLNLAAMGNVQGIIDTEAASDPRILAIDVFDDRGQILFSTQAVAPGASVPEAWATAVAAGATDDEEGLWRDHDALRLVVGSRLTSNFGFVVGGVALSYSRAVLDAVLARMLDLLQRLGVIIALIAALLGLLVSWLVFGGTSRALTRVREAVAAARADPAGPAFQAGRHPIERDYAAIDPAVRARLSDPPRGPQEAS